MKYFEFNNSIKIENKILNFANIKSEINYYSFYQINKINLIELMNEIK